MLSGTDASNMHFWVLTEPGRLESTIHAGPSRSNSDEDHQNRLQDPANYGDLGLQELTRYNKDSVRLRPRAASAAVQARSHVALLL